MSIFPEDKIDALQWVIQFARKNAPQGGHDQLCKNRLHTLEQMAGEAQREARFGSNPVSQSTGD